MNGRSGKFGFTLVEILVAVAIIVAVVSMLYGSYLAATKSAQAYNARMTLLNEGREVLEQMARQIRGSYAPTYPGQAKAAREPHGPAGHLSYPATLISRNAKVTPGSEVSYFEANADERREEVLHLVTTNSCSARQATAEGLFEIAYKLDRERGVLFLSEERFIPSAEKAAERRNWQLIAENIIGLELAFFDGRQWLRKWSFRDRRILPCAVRIDLICEDEGRRQLHFGTVAYVSCRNSGRRDSLSDTLVSGNRQ
ncbi:MAG: prepilin-type N-terminal cleavage/methylation domain-containing protein [Planctomycetota bacterium]|jgi:prepilin-type N-terminal cleavage/methylation domain-containing protein